MGYQNWKAVCPRCSTQNGSAITQCTNCGKGPILCEWRNFYGNRFKRFQCQNCRVIYNNTLCGNCGADIGAVATKSGVSTLVKVAGAAAVVLVLWAWFANSGGDKGQSGAAGVHGTNSGFQHTGSPYYAININGRQIAQGTNVICQVAPNATRIVVNTPGGGTSLDSHFGSDGRKGQTSITQNDNGTLVHWGTLWLDIGTVAQNGNSYKITGTVWRFNPKVQAPYEVDVTCP